MGTAVAPQPGWQTQRMTTDLRAGRGGQGGPVLVLLHGLGATSDVWAGWEPVLADRWTGSWVAPDLPGHGGSPPLPDYTFEAFADAVAGILPAGVSTVVIGHSLGGVVGLVLAGGGYPIEVERVIGIGIKVAWTGEELARARAMAERPMAWFSSRDDAAQRYLRVSGLLGHMAADHAVISAGLREEGGRWRLAMDQRTFAVGAPDMPGLLSRSRAGVLLARGEDDPMCTDEQLRRLGAPTAVLPGLGHNAHVENPAAVSALLDPP